MDYNATTPLEPEVIQAMTEAMWEAWGNPSSPYLAGRKARGLIQAARENLAKMIGGEPQDIIFTSGGTEANNLVIHSAVKHFHETHSLKGDAAERHSPAAGAAPHFITCTVEHDSVRLPLEHLVEEHVAEVTFVPVSKVNGRAEAEDILAAVRPSTCLVTVMLANNETGVIMPIAEISQRIKAENRRRAASGLPLVFLHTDAAQALGKRRVDVEDLGVDFLTIVGHKFYGPRIGALYVRGLGELIPLYPMLFGGGQERNFRPGTENTPMIAGLGKVSLASLGRGSNCFACCWGNLSLPPVSLFWHTHLQHQLCGTAPPCNSVTPNWLACHFTHFSHRPPGDGVRPHSPRKRAVGVAAAVCAALLPRVVLNGLPRCATPCPQAAQLVMENCEAYEAHMRGIRDYLEERLVAEFDGRIHLNSQFPGTERLPNTCNFSIRGPLLRGHLVLAQCRMLLASVGAACHSDHGDQPSPVLLSSGIPFGVAQNAIRLSVGRSTTRAEVDLVVQDLKQAVAWLEGQA
nr:selenocysteine lyase isoform X3 [Manis javanica]